MRDTWQKSGKRGCCVTTAITWQMAWMRAGVKMLFDMFADLRQLATILEGGNCTVYDPTTKSLMAPKNGTCPVHLTAE